MVATSMTVLVISYIKIQTKTGGETIVIKSIAMEERGNNKIVIF